MEDALEPVKKSRWVVVLLWLVPAWLLVSASGAIWMYFQSKKEQERKESIKFARAVSAKSIADDLQKLAKVIGPRHPAANEGIGLTRAAAWIEGNLGPSNTGYAVKQIPGPAQWPVLQIDLRGTDDDAPALWIVSAYDTPQDEKAGDATHAAAVVAQIAAAQALAGETFAPTLHFVFLPHGNETRSGRDPFAPPQGDEASRKAADDRRNACIAKLKTMIHDAGPALSILLLEDMNGGQFVNVSTPDTVNPVLSIVPSSFGTRSPWDSNHISVRTLCDARLPAVRVSASAAEEPDEDPLALVSGQLVELIRRLATKK
ncbi:hypothetical protein KBB96_07405 [Luteolibacter ambystomatis]|uniref:Uncharacterized protein n=1 Tax=Luteolibacter ambystomatis TaxID=2824561 RepID=A0A975J2A0_9BACT|nr:hypothetical protein [Luteolibacter ambystomatis]QUE52713.1 hypothetical protein KBB96_07405 [Luteolibacter ambystomatis]